MINTLNRATQTSIWMTNGPRHPRGLTPASRHIACIARVRSPGSLISWICFILGCISDIARICLICRTCSGRVTIRTIMVKTMMASPKLLNSKLYSITMMFSIGLISRLSKKNPIASKEPPSLSVLCGEVPCFSPVLQVYAPD